MLPAVRDRSRVRSSREWAEYFRANARRRRRPDYADAGVTADELAPIAPSLRGWQLGETSDGAHLRAAARDYAERFDDPAFLEAVELFIHEEQRRP